MHKALSFAFLAAGIVLAIFGANEMNSFSSEISRMFTGVPTNRALWMSTGGIVLFVLGAGSLLLNSRKSCRAYPSPEVSPVGFRAHHLFCVVYGASNGTPAPPGG